MPPRPLNDGRRHSREDFILSLPAEGALRLPDGRRVAVVPDLFLGQLHRELTRDLDDAARHSLYKFGYEWALQEMVLLSRMISREFGAGGNLDLWQMDAKFVLDRWWSPLAQAGWGTVTLDVSSLSRGFAFIELRHSTVVAALAGPNRATEPLCHLYAGLFAGALSFFERAERHGVEIQCAALGAPACRFAVGPGSQIDEVEMWRKQGIAPDEIRRRLT